VRYLLDSHALIWWWDDPDRLSDVVLGALEQAEATVFISAATAAELAIKVRLGKLPRMAPFMPRFGLAVEEEGFLHLPVHHGHSVKAGLLPGEHRDPFDRLIAAQALVEKLTVVTRDAQIARFGCATIW
jgi:PIN domain nuclease of toxin-antitoxin system